MAFMSARAVLLTATLLGVCGQVAVAQQDSLGILDGLAEDEREAVAALALYPEDIRTDILEAAVFPDALAQFERIHQRATAAIRELMEPLPREQQERFWDLARYPGLIRDLADGAPKTADQLTDIASRYPEEIRTSAIGLGGSQHAMLSRLHEIEQRVEQAIDQTIAGYPERTQQALRNLLELPEVLEILTEHMTLTVLVEATTRRTLNARWSGRHSSTSKRRAAALKLWTIGTSNSKKTARLRQNSRKRPRSTRKRTGTTRNKRSLPRR